MEPSEIVIGDPTPLSPADAGEVLTLQRAAYVAEAQRYNEPFLPPLVETLAEMAAELSGPALGLRAGSRLVGAVRWVVRDGVAHIARLIVAPDFQGRGIGTKLLRAAESASGVSCFELFTGARSEATLRLYRREGYAILRHEVVNDRVELVVLRKGAHPQ